MDPMEDLKGRIDRAELWEKDCLLKRGEYIKQGGEKDTNIYYVEEGAIRIYMLNDEGEDLTIRFGYAGNIITDLESFITEKPSDLYIQAIRASTLKVVSKNSYEDFIHSNAENERLWNSMLLLLVQMQMDREKDLLTNSPRERYARVLDRSPQLFQEIPLKYIASYLRMSPETLSRLRSENS